MRFGVGPFETPVAAPAAAVYASALGHAGLAEENGFDSAWALELHFMAEGRCSHAPALAAALAAATHALRIGVISPLGLTHPVYVAEDVAVLDHISAGRAEFAARVPMAREMEGYGLAVDERDGRFDEALEAVVRSWGPRPFRLDGRYATIPSGQAVAGGAPPQLSVTPKPAQLSVPLWLFVTDESQAARAARLGANVLLPPWDDFDAVRAKSRAFTSALDQAGRPRWTATVAVCREVFVWPQGAAEAVRNPIERRYGEYRDAGLTQDASFERLAPGRFVIGDVDDVVAELRRYRDEADIDCMVCRFMQPGLDPARADDSLRLFGRGVIPEFRMYGFPEELRQRAL